MKQMTLDGNSTKVPDKKRYVEEYCDYCSSGRNGKLTKHEIIDDVPKGGTGGELRCTECGSSRLWKIQGMNACLM